MQGTLQVHPCKLDGAIHGANAPACPTRPTSDSFRATTEEKKKSTSKAGRALCALKQPQPMLGCSIPSLEWSPFC
ncbi:hypothetical protein SRABI35_01992 [Stenotrophomonas lactitubi]|nr:hypothetical protein SRABI35_01992 [Stenotrophomonas lactitubi]